jgi:hypothetical protein
MRYRETNNVKTDNGLYSGMARERNGTTTFLSYTGTVPVQNGEFRCISDVVIPHFHRRSEKGEVFFNPLRTKRELRTCELSSLSYRIPRIPTDAPGGDYSQTWGKHSVALDAMGSPLSCNASIGDARVRNLMKLAGTQAKAGVDVPLFEGAIFLAELSETLHFLKNPLTNWNSFLRELKRTKNLKKFHRQKTVYEYLRTEWLSYRYGVRPLVGDVQDAINAIKATVENHTPVRKTARGSANDSQSKRTDGEPSMSGPNPSYGWSQVSTQDVSVRSMVLYEYHRSPNTFGVSISDVPIAAWNAVRLSFVIDWFVNVGTWIEAITPIGGIKVLGSSTSVKTSESSERTCWWAYGGYSPDSKHPRIIGADGRVRESLHTTTVERNSGIKVGLATSTNALSGVRGVLRLTDLIAIGQGLLQAR